MIQITKIYAKTALTRSKIPGVKYVINPYLGCAHGCSYCYAKFMAKWSKHHAGQPWGSFVEVKSNIADVVGRELHAKKRPDSVLLSSVCDPYQPIEKRCELTRKCLLLLQQFGWRIDVLTRSPLVIRDINILQNTSGTTVGMSIPTDSDDVRRVLEPHSPSIESRIAALRELFEAGISTWAFIGPMLPMRPERLHEMLAPWVEHVLIDRLNYSKQVSSIYRENQWEYALGDRYAAATESKLLALFHEKANSVCR